MTATPPGQPRWRLVADFAADLDTATKDRVVDLLADAALGADPAADVYAGRPSPWPATDPCRQVSGQPATPGDTLQLAAGRFAPDSDYLGWEVRSVLGELVNQLDAAPATYTLPADVQVRTRRKCECGHYESDHPRLARCIDGMTWTQPATCRCRGFVVALIQREWTEPWRPVDRTTPQPEEAPDAEH